MSHFPPQTQPAAMWKRALATIIDLLPLALMVALLAVVEVSRPTSVLRISLWIAAAVLIVGYLCFQWWASATRGAGIGAKALGIEVLGSDDGQPIGLVRTLWRQLIWLGLGITVIGVIVMICFMISRQRSWADQAVGAVVVQLAAVPPRFRSSGAPVASENLPVNGIGAQMSPDLAPSMGQARDMEANATDPLGDLMVSSPASGQWQRPLGGWQTEAPTNWQPPTNVTPVERPANPNSDASPPSGSLGWIPLPTPSSVIEPPLSDSNQSAGGNASRVPTPSWYLRLDDGREVALSVPVLLGRNPQRREDDPELHLVPAGGDGRMISRSHVLITTDKDGAVFVLDRNSTNGTALVAKSGDLSPCTPGVKVQVDEGQQVSYGDRWFVVLRRDR